MTRTPLHCTLLATLIWTALSASPAAVAATTHTTPDTAAAQPVQVESDGIDIPLQGGSLAIRAVAANAVQIHFKPAGHLTEPSLVIALGAPTGHPGQVDIKDSTDTTTLVTSQLTLSWDKQRQQLSINDVHGHPLLQQASLAELSKGQLRLEHNPADPLYGIGGFDAFEKAPASLLRHGKQLVKAGEQGHPGAPLVWSTAGYGVLVDTLGATVDLSDRRHIAIGKLSKPDVDYYLLVGQPADLFAAVSTISGASPLFPKWAMGFTNSQWGIDQKELLAIIDTYRSKHIPLDNFTIDFDWKAWGEDNYGEFRWNQDKFPDGPNGQLKQQLDARGMHLTGIMKPRVHTDTVEGRYATAHGLWFAGNPVSDDYFSHKPVRDIDFNLPAARAWFYNDALKHSFDTGMVGWWNDEADKTGSDTQFMNMQRALYEGQRAHAPQRVWSINRNFYLGSQRYAYGLWSGDIATGFATMAAQRQRMLSAIDTGAMQWGMDGGGFHGHPSDENYARWIEFGAFTPIFRVHGDFNEKRQPWTYGAIAEQAATAAIRLRYALIPYIYAYEYQRHVNGVGLVRPLLFDYPDDAQVRDDTEAWMFGDSLLVAPVVEQGQQRKSIYLPQGQWIDWFTGERHQGGQRIEHVVDSAHWSDIPLYIREGAIIPLQPAMDYVGQQPLSELEVEVFPGTARHRFDYYDDDGASYDYEHGAYFLQSLSAQRQGDTASFETATPTGSYKPALSYYLVKMHAGSATAVTAGGKPLSNYTDLDALRHSGGEGWANGSDRFGPLVYVRVAAGQTRQLAFDLRPTDKPPLDKPSLSQPPSH